jgi:hypothetical protein
MAGTTIPPSAATMGKIVRLHLESCETYVGGHQIQVVERTLNNRVIEVSRFELQAGLWLRFYQDMRKGDVIDMGSTQLAVKLACGSQSITSV